LLAALGLTLWFWRRRRGNKGDVDLLDGKGPMAVVEPFTAGGGSPSRGGGNAGEPFTSFLLCVQNSSALLQDLRFSSTPGSDQNLYL